MSVTATRPEPNRWAVLALLSVAQLMVVLDATIVTIAIPSAQNALHFSTDSRQWIVTAYALAFGSLLLLGGKLGDRRAVPVLRRACGRPNVPGGIRCAARTLGAGVADGDLRGLS